METQEKSKPGSTTSALTLKQLMPSRTQRMLIVGTTGCGKTTLARHLLASAPYECVLVIDPKCMYGGSKTGEEGYHLVRNPAQLKWLPRREVRIQYRPDRKNQSVWDYERVYDWAYWRRDIMVYTDEAFAVMNRTFAPPSLTACIVQGRELKVGMIFAAQRPKGIDTRILSESEVFAMFQLRKKDDKRLMSEYMGDQVLAPLPEYSFWFLRTGMKAPIPAKLRIGGG